MRRTRKIQLFLLLLVVSLLFGCSKTGFDAQNTKSVQESNSAQETVNGKNAPVNLKFTYWGSPMEKKSIDAAMIKFHEKYPWITVDAQQIPTDYTTKITTLMAANTLPDLGYMEVGLGFEWAEQNKLYNIYDFLDTDNDLKKGDFLDTIWYDWAPGKTMGPLPAIEPLGLFYNKDMFKELGVESPPTTAETAWTWDQFVDVTKRLTLDTKGRNAADPNFDSKNIKQYGIQFETWWGPWFSMVQSNGGDYISKDGTKLTLTEPAAYEAIQKMADLINVYHVAPSPLQAKNLPAPSIALQSKKVAMTLNGQWVLLDLAATNMNFGVGVLPKHKKSTTLVQGSVITIFKSTAHPKEAWLLYKWLYNPETVLDLHAGGLWMPALTSWYSNETLISKWAKGNKAHPEGFANAIMKQTLENGMQSPQFYVKNFGKIDALIGPALDQVWLGKKSAEQALKEIEPKVASQLKGRIGK